MNTITGGTPLVPNLAPLRLIDKEIRRLQDGGLLYSTDLKGPGDLPDGQSFGPVLWRLIFRFDLRKLQMS